MFKYIDPLILDLGVLSIDPYVLQQVGRVLLQQPASLVWSTPKQVIIADECFGLSTISSMRTSDVMARAVSETLGRRLINNISSHNKKVKCICLK